MSNPQVNNLFTKKAFDSFVVLVTNLIWTPVFLNLKKVKVKNIWQLEEIRVVKERSEEIFYLSSASIAPLIGALSTCKVPLKSISTALIAICCNCTAILDILFI